jgi:hypothetical protein
MYSRLMNVVDRILVGGFPVIVALGLAVILMALIANVLG